MKGIWGTYAAHYLFSSLRPGEFQGMRWVPNSDPEERDPPVDLFSTRIDYESEAVTFVLGLFALALGVTQAEVFVYTNHSLKCH